MKKLLSVLALVFLLAATAVAQTTTVKGVVMSAADEEPIPGATVQAVGSSIATVTDTDGMFTLQLPASVKKIKVSFIGMYTQELPVKAQMTIFLEENATNLNEVIVTGYGTQRKASFTGAASVVDGNIVERKSDANFVKSLEGTVTGFQYNNSTSSPGVFGTVYVRGMGSLSSSSQPLYVVDGVPVNSDADGLSSTSNNYFDPMAAFNPNDIESVTVLKDAAATAIYGSRAANGVIVITTKRGGDSRMSITLDMRQGFSSMANNNMKFADAETTMALFAQGRFARGLSASVEEARDYYTKRYAWDGVTSTDWINEISRKPHYQDYNLSINGTVGQTNYYVNLNYNDTPGIILGSGNQRYAGRVNLDTKYKFMSMGVNAAYSYSNNQTFSNSTSGSMSAPITAAISSMLPFYPAYQGEGAERTYYDVAYNPLALTDKELGDCNDVTNQTLTANPWFRIDLPYGLWAKTNFGVNIYNSREYSYWSAIYNPQGQGYNGLGQQYNHNYTTLTWTNTFGWDYTFNEAHSLNVLIGQEMMRRTYWYEYLNGWDYPFANIGLCKDLSTVGSWGDSSYYRETNRLASYFADAHYNFNNRYYFSASFRRDGSSIFGANKRWGNFWSVGGKWRLSEEKFLAGNTVVTNAALRASYGTVGNQSLPSVYAARGYYAAGYNYAGTPGIVPGQIANDDLSWETSKKFDVGFDLSLFNRAHLTFDYYNEDTDDALYSVPLSMTTGVTSQYKNIGKIRNRGVEFGVNGTVFTTNDVLVNVFANITWNKNKVLKLADGSVEGTYTIIEEGRPYRQFYMPEYAGVNKEDGTPLYYKNETGDETTGKFTEAAKRYVGSADPKVFGAFGINANAYGFEFAMQFNYRLGGKVYDTGAQFTGRGMATRTPLQEYAVNYWTKENPDAKYPRYIYGDPDGTTTTRSTFFLMNGSYLRLSNITLGYTVPADLTRKFYCQKLRFYTTFDNVHTWTASNFTGYNPDTYSNGVIAWQYPAAFTFTGGVQITF